MWDKKSDEDGCEGEEQERNPRRWRQLVTYTRYILLNETTFPSENMTHIKLIINI